MTNRYHNSLKLPTSHQNTTIHDSGSAMKPEISLMKHTLLSTSTLERVCEYHEVWPLRHIMHTYMQIACSANAPLISSPRFRTKD